MHRFESLSKECASWVQKECMFQDSSMEILFSLHMLLIQIFFVSSQSRLVLSLKKGILIKFILFRISSI